jgi:CheY-like chemotaxis protein
MSDERPRILVVDDESDTLLYLFDFLSTEGYFVEGSSSAVDALELVRRRPPAVVLADVRMPEMDGFELLERIKGISPKTQVILLSAFAGETLREETLRKGGEAFLPKPLEGGKLLRVLGRVMQGSAE